MNFQPPDNDDPRDEPIPTVAQVHSACMSYRHDFGLLERFEQQRTLFEAQEWLRAWRKEFPIPATTPHPETPAPLREKFEEWFAREVASMPTVLKESDRPIALYVWRRLSMLLAAPVPQKGEDDAG